MLFSLRKKIGLKKWSTAQSVIHMYMNHLWLINMGKVTVLTIVLSLNFIQPYIHGWNI